MRPEMVIGTDGQEVVLIHYFDGVKIICMPNLHAKDMASSKMRQAPHMRSDSMAAVTCPMCKRAVESRK